MKIAFIGQKGFPVRYGGVEKHVHELAVRLVRDGFTVDVYARPWYQTDKNQTYFEGVRIINLPSLKLKHFDAITHTFFATIHAMMSGNDIIHYHGVGPALLSWMPRLFSRAKVVVTFHCINRVHDKWGLFARFMLRVGEHVMHRFAHEVIAVSKLIARYSATEYHRIVSYIPNGISISDKTLDFDLIKKQFGLDKGGYFLLVSRLVADKGIHFAIEAYLKLKTDKKLVIVGDACFSDEYVMYLRKLAFGNSNIVFTGYQSGIMLESLYAGAYAFVHPTLYEGLPICILEALSFGIPIIASDIPENLEVMRDYGISFVCGSVDDLAKKMLTLIEEKEHYNERVANGVIFVRSMFTWDGIILKTIGVYKNVRYGEGCLRDADKKLLNI